MCKENQKKEDGDNMSAAIDDIIKKDNERIERFCRHQRARISELREIDESNPSREQISQIVGRLQSTGILDENGDLAAPYNGEE